LRQGGTVDVALSDGTTLVLSEDDVLIQRTEREGLGVANEGDITVALDTRLTAELIQEGNAREVVSKLQNLRKDLHFEVTDRIHIRYRAPAELAEVIAAQSAYICAETLALSLEAGSCADMHDVDINDVSVSFHLRKA
jgi:isoleucyl-tRNA synthetase